MKSIAIAAVALAAAIPAFAADVGVSIQFSQPGVYGRVDIGQFPQPQVVLQQPVFVGRPMGVRPEPVYMWVPPAHRRNWRRYCGQYRACGVPVYFVRDDWYGEHVRPHGNPHGRDDHDDARRDDHRGDRHGRDDHGRGDHGRDDHGRDDHGRRD